MVSAVAVAAAVTVADGSGAGSYMAGSNMIAVLAIAREWRAGVSRRRRSDGRA